MPLNRFPISRVNIGDVVTKLNTIQTIKTIDEFNAQRENLVQAVDNLKVHLTDQDTQISDLTGQVSDSQAQATALKSENDVLKQQINIGKATIDQLNARLAAVAAQPPPATPVALADSFRKVVDQIQAQARLQAAGGPATTIRSMDIEVKGLVNVQDGNTVLVLPTLSSQIDPNQLSTLRVSFAAIPSTGRGAAPAVTGISPTSGPASGGTSVTVTGSGFTGAGAVQFGGTPAATFSVVSDTQIMAVSPRGTGTVDVVVVTASGGASSVGAADQFTYIPAPAVTGVSPSSGPAAGGTAVTVSGAGFSNATAVTFGAIAASFKVSVSPTQISAISPPGTGTVDVVVTASGGPSSVSPADQFTYFPVPAVTGISPNSGPPSGGTAVTLTGTGFSGATAVAFGKTVATFKVVSDVQIAAVSPPGAGTVDVVVTTPGGSSSIGAADQFTYLPAPVVTAISPNRGPASGGTTVTVTGTRFTGATAVTFGTAGAGFQVVSDTQITAVSPPGTGTVHVVVTTPGGNSSTAAVDQFTYVPAPSVTSVNPSRGPAAGGTAVSVAGTALASATQVTFGTALARSFRVVSDTQIAAVSPPGTGTVDVVVTTVGGSSSTGAADRFTYVSITPPGLVAPAPARRSRGPRKSS